MRPTSKACSMASAFVMPMERFTTKGMEIDPEVLLDKRDFGRNLSFYIGDLERRWRQIHAERGLREPRRPTLEDIKRIRKVLRPDVESAFSLGSWLNGLEQELLQLTNEQIRISRRLAANPRMIVTGKAGTGKTVLAVQRALTLAERGLSVLYLCFNQLLARHVVETIRGRAGADRVTVRHLHGHYRDAIAAAGLQERLPSAAGDQTHAYGVVFPQLYVEALMETEPKPFDAVVVDEAQDILTAEHLDALDLTVDGGLESGRWHLFLDPQQNIYGQLSELAEKRPRPHQHRARRASGQLPEHARGRVPDLDPVHPGGRGRRCTVGAVLRMRLLRLACRRRGPHRDGAAAAARCRCEAVRHRRPVDPPARELHDRRPCRLRGAAGAGTLPKVLPRSRSPSAPCMPLRGWSDPS